MQVLFEQGSYIHDRVYVLLRGKMTATSTSKHNSLNNTTAYGNTQGSSINSNNTHTQTHTRELQPGSVIGSLAYFTDSHQHESVRAMTACKLACLTAKDFAAAATDGKNEHLTRIAMLTAETLCPTLRQFTTLGLKRELRRAGQLLFNFGSPANDVYVVASGRVRVASRGNPRDLRARRGVYACMCVCMCVCLRICVYLCVFPLSHNIFPP